MTTNETRHGISRDRLTQLITELNEQRERRGPQREAIEAIRAAGLAGDTWLVQCLMYEPEAMIWDAWNMPEGVK